MIVKAPSKIAPHWSAEQTDMLVIGKLSVIGRVWFACDLQSCLARWSLISLPGKLISLHVVGVSSVTVFPPPPIY